ncbi:hypothetical protein O0544_18140 [Edwardsiella anguillarum]|nr:hypothetical protein [Edwardsiella anguillarum]
MVACSFARIFYRNCINLGIPALSAPRAGEIRQGDALSIDIARASSTISPSKRAIPAPACRITSWR